MFKNEIDHSEMIVSQVIPRLTTKTSIFPKLKNRSSERNSKIFYFEKRNL